MSGQRGVCESFVVGHARSQPQDLRVELMQIHDVPAPGPQAERRSYRKPGPKVSRCSSSTLTARLRPLVKPRRRRLRPLRPVEAARFIRKRNHSHLEGASRACGPSQSTYRGGSALSVCIARTLAQSAKRESVAAKRGSRSGANESAGKQPTTRNGQRVLRSIDSALSSDSLSPGFLSSFHRLPAVALSASICLFILLVPMLRAPKIHSPIGADRQACGYPTRHLGRRHAEMFREIGLTDVDPVRLVEAD